MKVSDNTIQRILLPPVPAGQGDDGGAGLQAAAVAAQLQNEAQKTAQAGEKTKTDAAIKLQDFQLRMKEHLDELNEAAKDRENAVRLAEINGRIQLLLKGIEVLSQVPSDPVNSELSQSRTIQ